jgi:hypothetical protein
MTDSQHVDTDQAHLLQAVQLEKVRLENEKLKFELESLKNGKGKGLDRFIPYLPLITDLVTIAGFGFGVYQYQAQQEANRVTQEQQSTKDRVARELQSKQETEAAQREFMKPLLQNQLSLYLQATTAAATIATSTDPIERRKAINDFWRLYEGPLIMVETHEVTGAMVRFGNCLREPENCNQGELGNRSRAIGSRMQNRC